MAGWTTWRAVLAGPHHGSVAMLDSLGFEISYPASIEFELLFSRGTTEIQVRSTAKLIAMVDGAEALAWYSDDNELMAVTPMMPSVRTPLYARDTITIGPQGVTS